MGFFAGFWTWLNGQLADYIGTNTARVAEALEPAIVTLATVYLMVWGYLWSNRGLSVAGFAYPIAGVIVWALMGLLCVYTMFLIALSSIALAVLLALGPLFVSLLLFEGTRRFFEAWLAQLANYALITI